MISSLYLEEHLNTHQAKKVKGTTKCYGITSLRNLKKEILSTLHNCFTKGQCSLYSTSEKREKTTTKSLLSITTNVFLGITYTLAILSSNFQPNV